LQGQQLHIVAVAQDGRAWLSSDIRITSQARLLVIYDRHIEWGLSQALKRLAR
jgi:hypothetical protein